MTKTITAEHRDLLAQMEPLGQALASVLDEQFRGLVKFVLTLATVGDGGFATHVANVDRPSAAQLLREMAEVIEKNRDSPPGVLGQADDGGQ